MPFTTLATLPVLRRHPVQEGVITLWPVPRLKTVHVREGDVVGAEERARARILRIQHVHVVGADHPIAVIVYEVETEFQLFTVALHQKMSLDGTQVAREVDLWITSQVQCMDDLLSHPLVVFLHDIQETNNTLNHLMNVLR